MSSFDELAERLSDDAFRLLKGVCDNVLGDVQQPGEITVDLRAMAKGNDLSIQRCMDAFNELGSYMVQSMGREVWMRVCTPLWVNMKDGEPFELVVYVFPARGVD